MITLLRTVWVIKVDLQSSLKAIGAIDYFNITYKAGEPAPSTKISADAFMP